MSEQGMAVMQAEMTQATPQHLFQLPGGEWALWRWVALRGAGFPVDGVLKLSAPGAAQAADLLISIEARLQSERAATMSLFDSELARLKTDGRWDAAKSYRLWLIYAMRLMRYGKPPQLSAPEIQPEDEAAAAETKDALARVLTLETELVAARSEFEKQFASATGVVSEAIRNIAQDALFREAVAWQNRSLLRGGIDSLLRHHSTNGSRDSKQRENEEAVASYWQRYCVKNDTIGFFGPVAWARLVDEAGAFETRPGKELLAARRVYFEQWGIDALTALINKDTSAAAWALPRRLPAVRLEGDWLHVAFRRPMRLPAKQVAVLRACDGTRTAAQIAAHVRNNGIKWGSDAEVFTVLKGLKGQGLIEWQFEVPLSAYPERRLRELLERVDDDEIRRRVLSPLEEFEACRERVSAAAGSADELDAALQQLDRHFTNVTGMAATRWAGRMYTGRTLVYEDCRRDIEVQIGSDFIEELSAPVLLLLQSARWFTYEAGVRFRRAFREIYERLANKEGSRTIDAAIFRMEVQASLFSGNGASVFEEVQEEFRSKWEAVLAISPEQRRVKYRCEELRSAVAETFAAPSAGWKAALHHSPDLMIAADSVDAIRRGEYEIVLGELHLSTITINGSVFYEQHPSKLELLRAKESDLPEPQAVPVIPNNWTATRAFNSLNSAKDYYIEFTPESFVAERDRALLIADFVVEEQDGELVARTRDGRLCF
ncbi:MAG TPA: lantibiotic dehydratase, partial [Pyrinomonadaceae bacterium]|nr:lantibiotic dehydratase [Pyrinomonadaceae bacterium]